MILSVKCFGDFKVMTTYTRKCQYFLKTLFPSVFAMLRGKTGLFFMYQTEAMGWRCS